MTDWERLKEAKRLVTEAIQVLELRTGKDEERKVTGHPVAVAEAQLDLAHAAIEAAMANGERGPNE